MWDCGTVDAGIDMAVTIVFMAPGRLCNIQTYGFLARSCCTVKPHVAVLIYILRWLKAHLYTVVMILELGTGVVPFIPMRLPCEGLFIVPESSKDKKINPDGFTQMQQMHTIKCIRKKELARSFLLFSNQIFCYFGSFF